MQIPNIRFTEVISILDELNYADKVTSSLCLDAREVLRSNKDLVFSLIFSMPLMFWLLGVHWKASSTFSIWHSQPGVNLESGEELECLRR